MMKRNKITALLYFITSLLFYVSAILNFTSDVGMGVIYLCLGSTSLWFGATWLYKNKKEYGAVHSLTPYSFNNPIYIKLFTEVTF